MTSDRSTPAGTTPPVQISLPGQAHVAHGPHDQTGMYVFHHALRRDLARLEAAVRQTPVGDLPTWRGLDRRWRLLVTVLHHHHTIEDAAFWPPVRARLDAAGDRAGCELLDEMEAEHAQLDAALAAGTDAAAAMASHPCSDHRNALDVRVTAARSTLLGHLAHEEAQALPLLQRVMTPEDHAAAEAAARAGYPARLLPFLLPWSTEGLPSAVQRRLLAGNPVLRLALRALRPRFRRHEQQVFRHA